MCPTDRVRPSAYAAQQAAQRRARHRVLVRDVAAALAAVVVVVVGAEFRFEPNPEHPRAVALTQRLDEVYRAERAGSLDLPTDDGTVAPGILAAPAGDGRVAVAAEVDDTCYAMWWGPDGVRHARTVPDLLACTPRVGLSFEEDTVARSGLAAPEDGDRSAWVGVLPARTVVALWWIPLVLVAGAVVLSAAVRIIVVLVTGRTSVRGMD